MFPSFIAARLAHKTPLVCLLTLNCFGVISLDAQRTTLLATVKQLSLKQWLSNRHYKLMVGNHK